jgi:uncharacterized membrane protein YkoI
MRLPLPILTAILLLLVALGMPAAAQNLIDKRPRQEQGIERPRISLDQAVNMAESRYRAKAVKAQQASNGDRVVYHIRLLSDDGKVRTVQVDAQTGQMY